MPYPLGERLSGRMDLNQSLLIEATLLMYTVQFYTALRSDEKLAWAHNIDSNQGLGFKPNNFHIYSSSLPRQQKTCRNGHFTQLATLIYITVLCRCVIVKYSCMFQVIPTVWWPLVCILIYRCIINN